MVWCVEQRYADSDVADDNPTDWAYVPDPLILHPAVWEGKEIVVMLSDTWLLDQPATHEFPIALNVSYIGYGKEIPMFCKEYFFGRMSWSVSKTNRGTW